MKRQPIRKKNDFENRWEIQEAKARFFQLVEEANTRGYQMITKQGEPIAVILSKKEFDEMVQPENSLLDFFKLAPCQDIELDIQRAKDVC